MKGAAISSQWIAKLAEPYLRGYRVSTCKNGNLLGFWFLSPTEIKPKTKRAASKAFPDGCGFFVGYLTSLGSFGFLKPQPPECLVFAFVTPVGGQIHQKLVTDEASLVRRTAKYIGLITHRHPHFQFFSDQPAALVRHASMRDWPREKYGHLARNFFIETLAWLVRSALVRKLSAVKAVTNRTQPSTPVASPRKKSPSRSQKRKN